MIRFANSDYLYLLYFIPLISIAFWFIVQKQKKILEKFASVNLHSKLFPQRSVAKIYIKFMVLVLAMSILIIALANPQIGTKIEEVKQVGIDVFILLDVSKSMAAEDIKPSRIEKAKFEIGRLIQRLQGDRIGMVVFAGQAYIQFPLTTDYAAANLLLNAVDLNSVPQPGTAIGPAIDLALKSFRFEDETKKAIIVITDGEDHEGAIESVTDEAKSKGVLIYTIGFGTIAGVPIPFYNERGNQAGYKKDREGNIVLTKLNEDILKQISEKTDGKYYRGSNTRDDLENIYNDLAQIEQTEYGSKRITNFEDRFYYFLLAGILLLIGEFLISSNKSKFINMLERLKGVRG
jgi:Ca-activated chloride channel family protein